jgi:hypothetical protein
MLLKQMDCQNKEDAISEMSKYPGTFNMTQSECNPNQLSDSWKALEDDNQVIGYAAIEDKSDHIEGNNVHDTCYEEYEFQICIKTQYRGKGKGKQAIDLIESEIKRMNPNARSLGIIKSTSADACRMVKMLIDKGYKVKRISKQQCDDLEYAKLLLTLVVNDVHMYKQL